MTTNVLILCTHNSARSILAEGMLNRLAAELAKDVRAYSAGSAASGRVHPLALEALANAGVATAGLRSKSWDAFTGPAAPRMRAVVTVCDSAAKEASKRTAFELTRQAIGYRMLQLVQLPFESMDDASLERALAQISRS